MRTSPLRRLPAATALALVLFAAAAPALRAREAAPSAASWLACDAASAVAGADGLHGMATHTGVRQPFDGATPVASCSLAVDFAWSNGVLSVQAWDPLTLAPAAGSVALRSRAYDASALIYSHVSADFGRPIVTRSLAGAAEPLPTALALSYEVGDAYTGQNVHYWTDGPVGMPGALYYTPAGGTPLPGPHPVLAAAFCPGDEASQRERVVQSVATATALFGFGPYDYLQRFRVPERARTHYVELAFGPNFQAYPVATGHIAIYDAATLPAPPAGAQFPAALADADFYQGPIRTSTWGSHFDFSAQPMLEPGHDYWLFVRVAYTYPLWARALTGTESAQFQAGIGPLYSRTNPTGEWTAQPACALDFRLIGEPSVPVSVPPLAAPGALRLAVGPSPSRGAAMVRWSGARGNVRLEVLDPRGRRVTSFDAAGADGSWMWRGARGDGEPFAPGVYFVRAVDASGARGVARVVLLQ